MCREVVLPAPLGPRRPKHSPFPTASDMPATAATCRPPPEYTFHRSSQMMGWAASASGDFPLKRYSTWRVWRT